MHNTTMRKLGGLLILVLLLVGGVLLYRSTRREAVLLVEIGRGQGTRAIPQLLGHREPSRGYLFAAHRTAVDQAGTLYVLQRYTPSTVTVLRFSARGAVLAPLTLQVPPGLAFSDPHVTAAGDGTHLWVDAWRSAKKAVPEMVLLHFHGDGRPRSIADLRRYTYQAFPDALAVERGTWTPHLTSVEHVQSVNADSQGNLYLLVAWQSVLVKATAQQVAAATRVAETYFVDAEGQIYQTRGDANSTTAIDVIEPDGTAVRSMPVPAVDPASIYAVVGVDSARNTYLLRWSRRVAPGQRQEALLYRLDETGHVRNTLNMSQYPSFRGRYAFVGHIAPGSEEWVLGQVLAVDRDGRVLIEAYTPDAYQIWRIAL